MAQLKSFSNNTESNNSTQQLQNIKTDSCADVKNIDDCRSEVEINSTDDEATVIVPPDGGWGWIVVIASFICNMIVDGIIFSFGMFLSDIMKTFNASKSEVALVGSLLSGFYLMAGPFVSALGNKYGFRLVTILGSIIGSAAFVASSFATNVEFICITYGIVGGIGFGLIYVPAVITVGFYFEKWRALATGIAVCGSGIGTFVLAPVSSMLIEYMGWRHALIVQAALMLVCGVCGLTFRPIKPTKVVLKSQCNTENTNSIKEKVFDEKDLALLVGTKFAASADTFGSMTSLNSKTVPVRSNYNYPTIKEILGRSAYTDRSRTMHQSCSMLQYNSKSETNRLSSPVLVENLKLVAENLNKKEELFEPLIENKTIEKRCSMGEEVYKKTTIPDTSIQRPFYRDDIFYGASLQRLPQYTSHTSLGYHLSVTRLPTKIDLAEEKSKTCKLCPQSIKRILTTMFDFSLFKSPSFLLLAFSGFFTMMGFYVPFMYLTDRASLMGMEFNLAIWLVSVIGITNTVGRVLCGIVTSIPGCNALVINNTAITIAGIATLFSGFSHTDEFQFFYAAIFGLSIACFASLRSVLVVDLLGLERLTNAFGLLLLFQGVAATIGAPLAGAFMEISGSYDTSFYLSGGLITFSAIMCYPVNYINKWEKRRKLNNISNMVI